MKFPRHNLKIFYIFREISSEFLDMKPIFTDLVADFFSLLANDDNKAAAALLLRSTHFLKNNLVTKNYFLV